MNRLRSGAALIIVLLILVALLLLGLPFLYSQVWGLSGARSAQAAQAARVYLLGAEHLGAALGAYANTSVWNQTAGIGPQSQVYTALELYLNDGMPTPTGINPVDPEVAASSATLNRARIDAAAFGWNHGPSVQVGLEVSDEAGRLDPNLMDAAAWHDLFAKLDIPDWDDQEVTPPITWAANEGADQDSIGELANELEAHRIHVARYQRLEDLRIPSPQQSLRHNGNTHWQFRKRLNAAEIERLRPFLAFHNLGQGRAGLTDLGSVVASDDSLPPVANFKPYQVWLDIPAEVVNDGTWVQAEPTPGGRPVEGLVRLGSNASGFSTTISYKNNVLPAQLSGIWLQVPPLLNVNQVVPEIADLPAYKYAAQDPGGSAPTEFPDHTLLPITWYGKPGASPPKSALPWDYLQPRFRAATPSTPANAPAPPPRERQPLDLRSDGLIRVAAAATVLDAAGAVAAQGQRTTIVQALPQEQALERRWLTQGQFEPLVAQRFTSGMSTWPRATARVRDLQPADTDPATAGAPVDETGLAFTVRPSPAAFAPGKIPHLAIDWRAPLGSDAPSTQADVLKDYRVPVAGGAEARVDAETTGGLTPPSLIQAGGEGLFPDGVRLGSANQLAYKFDQTSGGPLRMADPTPVSGTDPNPRDSSLAFRHIGFWFRPETEWSTGTPAQVITLLEARPHPAVYGQFKFTDDLNQAVIPHGTGEDQNYFGVFYDPYQNMLVAAYTPPSATCTAQPFKAQYAYTAQVDDPAGPLTPWVDERCKPGTLGQWLTPPRLDAVNCLKWSNTLKPNRIMTCWKFGRRLDSTGASVDNVPEQGRWYHLQVVLGNGRPGGIALVVDGLAGTDVGLVPAQQYLADRKNSPLKGPWPGDHLTIPSLLLREDLAAIEKKAPVGATPGTDGSQFYLDEVDVEMPGFAPFVTNDYSGTVTQTLTPAHTLPSRGTVLIGDEYVRYESILAAPTGADPYLFKLVDCTRGFRQDTWADSTAMLERFPTTEDHKAGDRVITDGCRIPLQGGLYLGGGYLRADFASGPSATDELGNDIDFAITGTIQEVDDAAARPFSAPITVVGAAWVPAPLDGFVLLRDSNGSEFIYFYTKTGASTIQLEDPVATFSAPSLVASVPANPPHAGTYWSKSGANHARVTLISLELDDSAELTNGTFWRQPNGISHNNVLAQLMGPDGWCEWLRYTDIIRRNDAVGARGFLLNRNGWTFDPAATNRQRAQQRTAFREAAAGPFPTATSRVLPVQSNVTYPYTKILTPGDLITFVPKNYSAAQPVAAVVRYSANDGYGPTPLAVNDTINGWLGFTAPLRNLLVAGAAYEIVMGTGLNTLRDLTPLSNAVSDLAAAALPRLDAHASGTEPGRMVFGGQDVGRGGAANPDLSPAGHALAVMTIDAPYAGTWANSAGRLLRVYGGTAGAGIAATADLPVFVEADKPVFDRASGNTDNLSLLEIGGEVFACELLRDADLSAVAAAMDLVKAIHPKLHGGTASATWLAANRAFVARLVGRALLGSTSLAHRFSASPFNVASQLTDNQQSLFGNLDLGPEFIRLPVGPVRYLTDPAALTTNDWFTMADVVKTGAIVAQSPTKGFAAPATLVSDPIRSDPDPATAQHEVLTFIGHDDRPMLKGWDPSAGAWVDLAVNPNADKWIVASWLRGLYNTPASITWAKQNGGHGQLDPLAIGWWPRFHSALPSTTGSAPTPLTAQHFRSRVYNWVNLPLRLHNARFCDQAPPELAFAFVSGLPTNAVLAGTDPSLAVELRAMAGSIGGRRDVPYALGEGGGTQGDWSLHGGTPFTAWLAAGSQATGLFPWNPASTPDVALETDGVEVRISFRYGTDATSDLSSIARNANRSPLLSGAKLRCYAPLTTIAVEGNR